MAVATSFFFSITEFPVYKVNQVSIIESDHPGIQAILIPGIPGSSERLAFQVEPSRLAGYREYKA